MLDKQGQLKKQILNLELALSDGHTAKLLFEKQYENSEQFVADLEHYALKQQLFSRLLQELKIISYDNNINYNTYYYTKNSILESKFIEWVIANHKILHGILAIPSIDSIKTQPLIFISRLLSRLGIKQNRKGKSSKGCYTIDTNSLHSIVAIIGKRGFIKGNTCGNNIVNTTSNVPSITVPKSLGKYKDYSG